MYLVNKLSLSLSLVFWLRVYTGTVRDTPSHLTVGADWLHWRPERTDTRGAYLSTRLRRVTHLRQFKDWCATPLTTIMANIDIDVAGNETRFSFYWRVVYLTICFFCFAVYHNMYSYTARKKKVPIFFCVCFNTWQKVVNFFVYIKKRISYNSVYLMLACFKNFAQ